MKLKMLAAAVALAVTGVANAAIENSFTNRNGELFLVAYDDVAVKSYFRDLNILQSDWVLTQNGANHSWSGVGDTEWTDFLAATGGTTNVRWGVYSGAQMTDDAQNFFDGYYGVTTTGGSAGQIGMDFSTIGNAATYMDVKTDNVSLVYAGSMNTINSAYVDGLTDANSHWTYGNNLNGTTGNTVTTIGGTLYDYLLSLDNSDPTSPSYGVDPTVNQMAGTFSFASDGNLTYTATAVSAVPVPAAVWLFGSALLGLAGIARRRETV